MSIARIPKKKLTDPIKTVSYHNPNSENPP
jgi:hypothetical protein